MVSRSATIRLRATNRSRPRYSAGTFSFSLASGVKMLICCRLRRLPTLKSLKSWAGVILTAPVPFSGSACSSATIGISRSASGRRT